MRREVVSIHPFIWLTTTFALNVQALPGVIYTGDALATLQLRS